MPGDCALLGLSPTISLCTRWIFLIGLRLVAAARVLGVRSTTRPLCSRRTGMCTSRLGLDLVRGGRVGEVLGDRRNIERPCPPAWPLLACRGLAYLTTSEYLYYKYLR